ncbi:MAG: hypothetical protein K9I35_07190 [Flavobacterium sp.]|nr:hypothetical protein [Flavobacterium sp.]
MCYFKKIIFLLLFSIAANAQLARPFVDVSVNRESLSGNNTIFNCGLGIEFRILRFISPEISAGFSLKNEIEKASFDSNNILNGYSFSKANSINFSFCPKILIYTEEENHYSISILPKYSFSKINASIDYATVQNLDIILPFKNEIASANVHSFTIGVGFNINLDKEMQQTLAFNLYLNNIDFGKALNQFEKLNNSVNTKNYLGFGLIYYFSFSSDHVVKK